MQSGNGYWNYFLFCENAKDFIYIATVFQMKYLHHVSKFETHCPRGGLVNGKLHLVKVMAWCRKAIAAWSKC